jgi:hypothetical protein
MNSNIIYELEELFKEYVQMNGYSRDAENALQKCKNFLIQSKNYWPENIENVNDSVVLTVTNGNYVMDFICKEGYVNVEKRKSARAV